MIFFKPVTLNDVTSFDGLGAAMFFFIKKYPADLFNHREGTFRHRNFIHTVKRYDNFE